MFLSLLLRWWKRLLFEAWYLACCNMGFANCWSDDYTPERCCPWPPQTPAPGSGWIDLVVFLLGVKKNRGGLGFVWAEATWWCKHLGELNFGRFLREWFFFLYSFCFMSKQDIFKFDDNMHVWEWRSKNTKAISTRSRLSIGPISRRWRPSTNGTKTQWEKSLAAKLQWRTMWRSLWGKPTRSSCFSKKKNLRATWAEPTEEVTRGSRTNSRWKKRYEEKISRDGCFCWVFYLKMQFHLQEQVVLNLSGSQFWPYKISGDRL